MKSVGAFLFLIFFGFFLFSGSASAATIYANYSIGNDTTGDGSLGNPYKTFHKAYTMAASNDTIDLNGTFTWANADETGDAVTTGYTISKNLIITGQSATSTIIQAATASTTADRRVFTIDSTASTTFQNLTIRHGRLTSGASSEGGGILNSGTTTIDRVHVRENYVQVSTSGTGGGINNKGTLTVRDSAILYNHALSQGGGIASSFTGTQGTRPTVMYIINTTIAYNTQTSSSATVGGPGIFAREGTVYVLNSSIVENNQLSSNTSYAPAVNTGGGTVHLKNTIVANNKQQGTYLRGISGAYDVSGITDAGNNIISKVSSTSGLNTNTWYDHTSSGSGDDVYRKVGSASPTGGLNINSTLDTDTGTFALLANSVAIDNATTTALGGISVPTTDQRGLTRVGTADIGAFEYGANSDFTAPTITNISSDKTNGSYKEGEVIDIDVTFSEIITSAGDVTVTLETGAADRTCIFTVTASTTGTCNYTVQAGDTTNDLDVNTISGTITDSNSNAMVNFVPTTNLAANKSLIIDTTAPETPTTSPIGGTYTVIQTVSLSSASSSAIYYSTNGDTPTATSTATSTLYSSPISVDSSQTIKAIAIDTAGNLSSVMSEAFVINLDPDAPVLSNIMAFTSPTGAIITWDTNEDASALVNYGLTSATNATTSESDLSPRDASHSVSISGLVSCARYYYKAQSTDGNNNTGYSSTGIFKTTGCTGDSTIIATGQGTASSTTGGSVSQGNILVTIPTSFKDSVDSAIFQANKLDSTSFTTEAGTPTGFNQVGTNIYTLKALTSENTNISTFDSPITITMNYSDDEISSIDESSLWIYRYDGSTWHALSGCIVDQNLNTVICDTTSFSDFALFGEEEEEPETEPEVQTNRSSGNTVESRVKNLLAIGKTVEAEALMKQYSNLFPKLFATSTIPVNVPTSNTPSYTRDLQSGSTGEDVRNLQKFLNGNGYIIAPVGPGSPENETNLFGILTREALAKFQSANGILPAAGFFGPKTREFIANMGAKTSTITPSVVPLENTLTDPGVMATETPVVSQTVRDLEVGMEGADVTALQKLLINKEYSIPAGATGFFANQTREALAKYQSDNGIVPAIGYFGIATRTQMKSAGLAGLWW